MSAWVDTLLVLLVISDFLLLGSMRLGFLINAVAMQGLIIGILTIESNQAHLDVRVFVLAAISIAAKSVLFPTLLRRASKLAGARRETEPLVGPTLSLIIATCGFALAWWMGDTLPLPPAVISNLIVPVSLFTIFSGFYLLVSRNKALTEVIGYLVMENGIYSFGMAMMHNAPMAVELAVLLDVAVGIFVMGIIINLISREIGTINVKKLSNLRDEPFRGPASEGEAK